MLIVYDETKRAAVLEARGLDFNDAGEAFVGFHITGPDNDHSDEEDRYKTFGMVKTELAIIIWTERDGDRRIITMWKANAKERRNYERIRSASE